MRIGPYTFDTKRWEGMGSRELDAYVEAVTLYRDKRKELENLNASLQQYLSDTFKEIESNYDCEVIIDGEPWHNAIIKFQPSDI